MRTSLLLLLVLVAVTFSGLASPVASAAAEDILQRAERAASPAASSAEDILQRAERAANPQILGRCDPNLGCRRGCPGSCIGSSGSG